MDKKLTEAQLEKLADSYLGDDFPHEVVLEYISDTGDDDLRDCEEAYSGCFESDKEFAQDMADNLGLLNTASQPINWPFTCIDWDFAAKELMYDYSVYVAADYKRYYFRNL